MALRRIALQGEECLAKVCRPVTEFNGRLHTLLDDMKDTLLDSGGVGLAAPQVGVLRRVCVVMNEDDEIIELINPEIIKTEGKVFDGLFYKKIRSFLDAIKEGKPAPVPSSQILYNQAIIDGIVKSAELGREIEINIPKI